MLKKGLILTRGLPICQTERTYFILRTIFPGCYSKMLISELVVLRSYFHLFFTILQIALIGQLSGEYLMQTMYTLCAIAIALSCRLAYALEEQKFRYPQTAVRDVSESLLADQSDESLRREEEIRRREDEDARRRAKEQTDRASLTRESHDGGLPARDAIKFLKNF